MKKLCFLTVVAFTAVVFNSAVQASREVSVFATQGKACDGRDTNGDGIAGNDVMGNTTQLMTRSGTFPDAKKSWLQFDLSSLYAEDSSIKGHITDAKLTVYGAKIETSTKRYTLYGLKDAAGLENWVASSLTWNNAPGNDITQGKNLDAAKTTSFYTMTIPVPVMDVMTETPSANRAALTTFLNTDTDGKVTFIFTAGDTTYLWNAGQPLPPKLTLTYNLGNALDKAHYPVPGDGATVETSLASLSWTNPAPKIPGGVITCDVYLGTEPNRLDPVKMNKKTLGAGISTVAINTTNFPTQGTLLNQKIYYWAVDVHDSSDPNVLTGQIWTFFTNNNQPPVANAGADKAVWLGKSGVPGQEVVALSGTATDDGLPNPPHAMTYTWTQVANGAPTVAPVPVNTLNTNVTITARGSYEFQLLADDSNRQGTDTVKVFVGTNACDASHLFTGAEYNAGDFNLDCAVNLQDILILAAKWLNCTDTLTACVR